MNPKSALRSLLQFTCVFTFFTIGLFVVCLPYLPKTRGQIIEVLTNSVDKCTDAGIGILLITLFLTLAFYGLNQGRYIVIKMGVTTNIKLIRHAVEECFYREFPKKIRLKDIELGPKAHLYFKVSLAPLDEAAREDLYIGVENQLNILLKERFGYSKPFNLIVKN